MSTGKHMSLEEARKRGQLDRFIKEHPSEGDAEAFDALLEAMAHGDPPDQPKRKTKKPSDK